MSHSLAIPATPQPVGRLAAFHRGKPRRTTAMADLLVNAPRTLPRQHYHHIRRMCARNNKPATAVRFYADGYGVDFGVAK